MSTGVSSPGRAQVREKTLREDNWWLSPLLVFLGFTAFIVYSTWRAFSGDNYYSSPYLSPFFSPCLATSCVSEASDFGQPVGDWWKLSPALIILVFPLGFRLTCYYYRKAYYRAFWLSPPACGVAEPHGKYTGETRFPLIFQNIHRYFWFAAVLVGLVLSFDALLGFHNERLRRTFDIRVAGPAALLVAKLIKIGERLDQSQTRPDRLKEKDALDTFRILQAISTADLVAGLRTHQDDANAQPVSATALTLLRLEGLSAAGALPRLASTASLGDPTVAPSFVALAEQLIASTETHPGLG